MAKANVKDGTKTSRSKSKDPSIRKETDFWGEVTIPAGAYYGSRVARALVHFDIGEERMPRSIIRAFGILKKATTTINAELNLISKDKANLIIKATEDVISGDLDAHFPLTVWQSGAGAQTNMNVNEVIANRAIEISGGQIGTRTPIHPNDDVNKSQSSNDAFSTAMHIAAAEEVKRVLLPVLKKLRNTLEKKSNEFTNIVKVGRTHLVDAAPLSLGQEISAYVQQIDNDIDRLEHSILGLYELPIGGTAVGTGLNAPKDFGEKVSRQISKITKLPFVSANNKFESLASHDALVFSHGALKTLACTLLKLSNDIILLASGPRCGIGELKLPDNDLNSLIMPGKVNPIQCEALNMVCAQVLGNDTTISFAGASGQLQLNTFKPVIIYNYLQSTHLLAAACKLFEKYCLAGLKPNKDKISEYLNNSLIVAMALAPHIGYEATANAVQVANKHNISLKEAVTVKLKLLSEDEYERIANPANMVFRDFTTLRKR
ncbi:MAG: class II fumarate hydratase [Ignavibacteria bacterium]|nr:class II fumarate hydratase [Ignavibacteria bacterium]